MNTFLLDDGDLVLASGSYEMTTGHAKLRQDLGIAMREPLGVDRFHPRWGSRLGSYIGEPVSPALMTAVEAEARRILDNYIVIQRDRITRDATAGRPPRYGSGEVIDSVRSVQVRQEWDRLHLRCTLRTLTADEVVVVSTVRG